MPIAKPRPRPRLSTQLHGKISGRQTRMTLLAAESHPQRTILTALGKNPNLVKQIAIGGERSADGMVHRWSAVGPAFVRNPKTGKPEMGTVSSWGNVEMKWGKDRDTVRIANDSKGNLIWRSNNFGAQQRGKLEGIREQVPIDIYEPLIGKKAFEKLEVAQRALKEDRKGKTERAEPRQPKNRRLLLRQKNTRRSWAVAETLNEMGIRERSIRKTLVDWYLAHAKKRDIVTAGEHPEWWAQSDLAFKAAERFLGSTKAQQFIHATDEKLIRKYRVLI